MDHYDTIQSLLIASQVIGLAPFYPKDDESSIRKLHIPRVTLLNTIIFLGLYYGSAIYLQFHRTVLNNDCFLFQIVTAAYFYENYVGMLFVAIAFTTCFLKRKQLMEMHSVITEIDQDLLRLGRSICFGNIRRKIVLVTSVLMLSDIVVVVVVNFALFSTNLLEFGRMVVEQTPSIVFTLVACYFVAFMIALRYRFFAINSLLVTNCKMYMVSTVERNLLQAQEIDDLIKVHDRLCDVADEINSCYGFIMLCLFANIFIIINVYIFLSTRILPFSFKYHIRSLELYSYGLLCLALNVTVRACVIIFSVQFATEEASASQTFVHKTINFYRDSILQNKLTIFLMQLTNRKPTFTACGLFEINLPLLFGMIGAVFTYFIILVQFDQADNHCATLLNLTQEALNMTNTTATITEP